MSTMMPPDSGLDTCGCCEQNVPRPHLFNRPGLAELEYRVGTHGTFLRRMLSLLPSWPPRLASANGNGSEPELPPLARLTSRSKDDPSIAVLDAWATLADVLTFYQERIANEGYLRTATERRSVLELSRTIGYELNPGVAASTFLAFKVDDRPPPEGIPPILQSVVAKGTKVQSMPAQGQLPQTFETSSELTARPEWNVLRPRLTVPQPVSLGSTELYIAGIATGLERGDRILITGPRAQQANPGVKKKGGRKHSKPTPLNGVETALLEVTAVEPDAARSRTRIGLVAVPKRPPPSKPPAPTPAQPLPDFDFTPPPAPASPPVEPAELDPPVMVLIPRPLTAEEIAERLLNFNWTEAALRAQLEIFGWGIGALIESVTHQKLFPALYPDLGPVFEWVTVVPAKDNKRPSVVSVFPPEGAPNVHPRETIIVTFSEPMDAASAEAAVSFRTAAGAPVTTYNKAYHVPTGTVRLTPQAGQKLVSGTTYVVVVANSGASAAKDSAGNVLAAEFRSSFTVLDYKRPELVPFSKSPPLPRVPPRDATRVPTTTQARATFDEGLTGANETSFYLRDATGTVVPAKVSLSTDKKTAILVPKRPLALSSRYTASLTNKITDIPATGATPNTIAPVEWSFATALRPDDAPESDGTPVVYAFRDRAAFFGHNAPKWESLPKPSAATQRGDDPYPNPWDDPPRSVWVDSQGSSYGGDTVYLDRSIPNLEPDSWAVLESGSGAAPYFVTNVADESLADYGISGRAARLTLSQRDGKSPSEGTGSPPDFKTRQAAAHVRSEQLVLVELPIEEPLKQGDTLIVLDHLVIGLSAGQPIALRGELVDLPGVIGDEIVVLRDVLHTLPFTTLVLESGLEQSYVRKTATLCANVVPATHGETVRNEILGGGDGSQPNRRFTLRKPPLTYVSAPNASGSQSTLRVRVDDVLWSEAPNLYELGPRDEGYIVRTDEDGTSHVIFGDGAHGARPPTGTENIVATYRNGIGSPGLVGDERITLLQERPLGIASVTNPVPPAGAEDREDRDSARTNAPLTVLTMERIVSLSDFEDFARAFAGIGKAQAVAIRRGELQLVHLTVAGINGAKIGEGSELFKNLVKTIESSRDPGVAVHVRSFTPIYFNVSAVVIVDERFTDTAVLAAARAALLNTFSFERRAFAQPVSAAEVITAIQNVPGVVAVDLDALYRVDEDAPEKAIVSLEQVIAVERARFVGTQALPAQLLLVNPGGIAIEARTV